MRPNTVELKATFSNKTTFLGQVTKILKIFIFKSKKKKKS